MQCYIYKSLRKSDTYLFLGKKDDFSDLPEKLQNVLGKLEWVMELRLDPEKKLAQADAKTVIKALSEEGFYLQMPQQSLNNPVQKS